MHWATSPDHSPIARHSLISSPLRSYPSLQIWLAVLPNVVSLTSTAPLSGNGGWPQSIAILYISMEKDNAIYWIS